MRNVSFLKNPGYVYDLFFLFVLNFNKEKCIDDIYEIEKSNKYISFFENLLMEFSPFSSDLFPFFYIKDNNKCFMTHFYFDEYASQFMTTYTLSTVQEALADHEQVIENMLRFYFGNASDKIIKECLTSPVAAGRLIKQSEYSGELKSSLYAFFLEPAMVIQKLACELTSKQFLLEEFYQRILAETIELQQGFDLEEVENALGQCDFQRIDFSKFQSVCISFCVCTNYCVKGLFCEDSVVILLGRDYKVFLERIATKVQLPALDQFGNALSEQNRLDILELIWEKQEVTIRDIEQSLGFSGTNAYYHLSLMIKANMIKSRNRGRTVVYSINRQAFVAVCDLLSKYSTKTPEEEF